MSFEYGTLVQWNDLRGFGFIKPDQEDSLVFVHIKTFGPVARRPVEGDRVYFDSSIGAQGKRKATVARITDATIASRGSSSTAREPSRRSPSRSRQAETGWSSTPRTGTGGGVRNMRRRIRSFMLLLLVPIIGVSFIASRCTNTRRSEVVTTGAAAPESSPAPSSGQSEFQCQGKQHCTQMRSKEEAQYYLANCPDVRIDGDGDGIACEDQFGH